MASKDPAFLFYPADFLIGTQFFSDEQVGKYLRLLLAQHQHGHLSEKQVIMICKTLDKDVMSKFKIDSDGMYFNERLDTEKNRRAAFSKSRSANKAGKTKEVKNTSESYDNHMENENENVSVTTFPNVDSNKEANFFKIEDCLKIAMKDQRWVKANGATEKELEVFNAALEKAGEYKKLPADYKSHFSRWKPKKVDLVPEIKPVQKEFAPW